jgi:hypothetical protein
MTTRLIAVPMICFLTLLVSIFTFGFDYAWFMIFPIVGFIFMLTSWLVPFIWIKRVPAAARILEEAGRTKAVPAYIVHDSGRGAFVLLEERRGEGLVFARRAGQQRKYRTLPRAVDLSEADFKDAAKTSSDKNPGKLDKRKKQQILDYSSDWINKRSICVGLGLPIYFGYSGTLCLLNPECMAWYEAGQIFVPTDAKPQPVTEEEKKLPWPLMFLSALDMKKIINRRFDTSQIDALEIDARLEGALGRGMPRWLIYVVIGILIVVVIAAVIFMPPFQ